MEKFEYITNDTILSRLESEGQPMPTGGYDDYLKLPVTEEYEKNEESKLRRQKEEQAKQKILKELYKDDK